MTDCDISIIIPTKNSGEKLNELIKSIQKNSKNVNYEIIIIDNFSDNITLNFSNKFNIKLFQNDFKRAKAKNYGAKISNSNNILFLDSDMKITNDILSICIDKLKSYDALCIKELSWGNFLLSRIRNFEMEGNFFDPYLNVARCFKKEVFFKCNGYDESLEGGEDLMLQKCIIEKKINLGWIDTGIIHDESNINIFEFLKKQIFYSKYLKSIKGSDFWKEVTSLKRRLKNLKNLCKKYSILKSSILLIFVLLFRTFQIFSIIIVKEEKIYE